MGGRAQPAHLFYNLVGGDVPVGRTVLYGAPLVVFYFSCFFLVFYSYRIYLVIVPALFGQKVPAVFAQKVPAVFGQKLPAVFGQKVPALFAYL